MDSIPLVTFSHLRWDFVYQRPQHVMTRLAENRPVLFVEEPVVREGEPFLEIEHVADGVRVARPHIEVDGPAFGTSQQTPLVSMLRTQLRSDGWNHIVAWLYTPMAVRVAKALHPRAILYDCMDDLSGFLGAPKEIAERDRELLAAADAVLTGGPSLYKAKSDRHAFVHCFPSSVDVQHFTISGPVCDPKDQARISHPRLGYCGVIDERIDLAILERLASAHPEWQIVLVGPVVKIDPDTLPQAPNIHYLGRKEYEDLPRYLGGWDLALMPFALNSATRYISPTKVLEYMAADQLIVSTPITDVAEPYGDIVYLGEGSEGFLEACERAMAASTLERAARRAAARRVLSRTSWEKTARRMDEIIRSVTLEVPSEELALSGAGAGWGGAE